MLSGASAVLRPVSALPGLVGEEIPAAPHFQPRALDEADLYTGCRGASWD